MKINILDAEIGYGKKAVVSSLNFELGGGDFVALIGPNGAGKSTLLNSMIGILPLLKGRIEWYIDFDSNPFNQVGFSPQTQLIDWYTTVFDNVIQGPLLAGISYQKAKIAAQDALSLLDIENLSESPVDHLSGGQQQRVQIAREIARDPQIYILDEPTTGLDVETAENLFQYLKNKVALGKIVLTSSHDLTLLNEYVNKVLFIDGHRPVFFGPLKEFSQDDDLRKAYLKERKQ